MDSIKLSETLGHIHWLCNFTLKIIDSNNHCNINYIIMCYIAYLGE